MKRKDFRISPYILIPVIFSGISLLAVIVTYRITSGYLERNIEPVTQLLYLGAAAVILSVTVSCFMEPIHYFACFRRGICYKRYRLSCGSRNAVLSKTS